MKKNYQNILIIFLIAIVLLLPLWVRDYRNNDDTSFHVANISATVETMDNFIPSDILPNIAKDYGYATRQFYPPLSHTTAAYITKILDTKVTTSLKITYTIILFLSGVTMYYLSFHLSKSKKIALLSSIIYMTFPYHLSDIYIRDALAESFIFIFLPMILDSFNYLYTNKRKFYFLFVTGYVLGMLSHLTMMIYFTVLLIPYFIINYKKIFNKQIIFRLVIASIFILGITSPLICNMFQNKLLGNYMVFYPEHMAQGIWHSGVKPSDLFGYQNVLSNKDIKLYLNIAVLVMLIITFLKRKKLEIGSNYKFFLIFGITSFVAASIIFPWDILPNSFRIIQFPWRLMTMVSISVSLFAPLFLKQIMSNKQMIYGICFISIISLALLDTSTRQEIYNINNIDYSYGMGWQKEYLPYNTYQNIDYFNNRKYGIISSSGVASIINDNIDNLTFKTDRYTTVELPRLYYFGYVLKDQNNNQIEIKEDKYGFIIATVNEGVYTLKYEKTSLIKIAEVIAMISFGSYCFYIIFSKEKYGQD